MDNDNKGRISKADFIGLVAAFIGAIISIIGAIWIYSSMVQFGVSPLWPLPGLALADWALMGLLGFVAAYFVFRNVSVRWQQATWFISGAFIPLVILGAFSIGPFVLISFVLFMVSSLVLAVQRNPKWLENFGLLMLGAIINLIILFIIITLSTPQA